MLHRINNVGIQQRLLILAILPVIITTMLLGYYVITSRIDDINSKLLERGKAFAKHIAPSAEFGIVAGNKDILQRIVSRSLKEDDVVSIAIFDDGGELLINNRNDIVVEPGDVIVFVEPIIETSIEVNNAFDQVNGDTGVVQLLERKVGEVKVELSKRTTREEEKIILVNSFLIMASGLLLSAILALRIGGTVANPIIHLTRAMQLLRGGNFDSRVQVQSEGELGTLQSGFNSMAETLQESQKGLQNQVETATQELRDIVTELERKNDELEEARREAIQAGQAKLDFLAKMSHEIRTPVNAILGFAKLLERVDVNEGSDEYIRTINQASRQLLCVIDDILDFSKIEYGTLTFENIPFNFRDVVEDVVVMQRPAAFEKSLELVVNYFSDVPDYVFGDSTRISQVLTNLLNNSLKFTDEGSIVVQVESHVKNEQGIGVFTVSVIDSGIGVSQVEQEKLFRPFSQVDTTIRRRFGGTGLGLVIAKRIVENMGGEIGVESEKGRGARFWFTLPLQVQSERDVLSNESNISGLNVLVLDANPLARRSLRNVLVRWGCRVVAVAALDKVQPDVVDYRRLGCVVISVGNNENVPGILLTKIQAVREMHEGPILILMANEECILPSSMQKDVSIACLTKPSRSSVLLKKMESLVGAAPISALQEVSNTPPMSYKGIRILVAEDNAFNKTLITTLLKQLEIEVILASTGKEAIEQYLKEDVDMILMDIHMPEMDGLEATKQIRLIDAGVRKPPIIALTADVFVKDRENLDSSGLDDYLIKPLNESSLKGILEKYLSNGEQNEKVFSSIEKIKPASIDLTPDLKQRLLEDMQKTMGEIKAYLESGGAKSEYRDSAHTLLGLIGYYEIGELIEMAKTLDTLLKENKTEDAIEFFVDVEEEVNLYIGKNKDT